MFRNDKIFANKNVNQFSIERLTEEYTTFTEKFNANRQGYLIDENGLIRADTAPTLSYSFMMDLFKSKDLDLLEKHKDIFEKKSSFLDGKEDVNGNQITYLTFARCGSTFLRNYLEKMTAIATGSTMF